MRRRPTSHDTDAFTLFGSRAVRRCNNKERGWFIVRSQDVYWKKFGKLIIRMRNEKRKIITVCVRLRATTTVFCCAHDARTSPTTNTVNVPIALRSTIVNVFFSSFSRRSGNLRNDDVVMGNQPAVNHRPPSLYFTGRSHYGARAAPLNHFILNTTSRDVPASRRCRAISRIRFVNHASGKHENRRNVAFRRVQQVDRHKKRIEFLWVTATGRRDVRRLRFLRNPIEIN